MALLEKVDNGDQKNAANNEEEEDVSPLWGKAVFMMKTPSDYHILSAVSFCCAHH